MSNYTDIVSDGGMDPRNRGQQPAPQPDHIDYRLMREARDALAEWANTGEINSDVEGLIASLSLSVELRGETQQPAPQPCPDHTDGIHVFDQFGCCYGNTCKAQMTAPQQPAPQPLTDEQKLAMLSKHFNSTTVPDWFDALILDIERAHGIGGQ